MLGIQPKFQTCEKQKIEKRKRQKKNNHTHKTVFTWFRNLLTSTECRDFTIIKENYNVQLQCFSFSKTTRRQNPNHKKKKKNGFYILRTGFTMGYKNGSKIFCRPKPPLHGLSLSKFPILRVRSGYQPDQIMPGDDFSWNKIHPLSSL